MSNTNNNITNRTILIAALSLSLTFGFLDIYFGLKSQGSEYMPLSSILLPLAVTTGIYFLTYLILWYMVGARLVRRFKFEALLSAISTGVFMGVAIVLISIIDSTFPTISAFEKVISLIFIMTVSFIAMVLSYLVLKKIKEIHNPGMTGLRASLLIPLILGETLVFTYLNKYGNISIFILYAGYALTVLCAIGIFYFINIAKFRVLSALTALMILIVICGPLVVLINQKRDRAFLSPSVKPPQNEIKHVILITVDTLRTDVLSAYGSQKVKTPSIDGLAGDGILFKNAYSSAPWTLPAFSSIMTGLPPGTHLATTANSKLSKNFKTTAEYMLDSGYYTTAFVRNIFLHPEYNVDQGFIDYYHYPHPTKLVKSFGNALIRNISKILMISNQIQRTDVTTADITDMSINWLKNNRDKDFFLWIHYFDPHEPYAPPEKYMANNSEPPPRIGMQFDDLWKIRDGSLAPNLEEREWIKELYDAEVRYVDDNVGRLLDYLKESQIYDDSLIVFTSDHGEEFWDHGGVEHGHSLYNELLHVPLIIKLPKANDGNVENMRVTTQSIMRTVLDACGISYDRDRLIAGSLYPLLVENRSEFTEEPLVSTGLLFYGERESVIFDDKKYIRSLISNEEELYDLTLDPDEKYSINENSSRDGIAEARGILKTHKMKTNKLAKHYGVEEAERVVLSHEKKEELKALGYMQ